MADVPESEATVPAAGETEQAPPPADATTATQGTEPDGTERVEFSDPKVAARFKRIYSDMRKNEQTVSELGKINRQLIDKLDAIEAKTNKRLDDDNMAALKAAKKAAYEAGDIDKVTEIDDRIIELRLAGVVKPEVKPAQVGAPLSTALAPDIEGKIIQWAHETDAEGGALRPWVQPGHPKHERAFSIASAVVKDPDFADKPAEVILAEVDRLMGTAKVVTTRSGATNGASVLPGNRNIRPNGTGSKVTLSPDQERTAKAMGLTPEKYKAAMAKYGSTVR